MPITDLIKSDPLVATNFFLEIKGEVIDTLSEVSGLDVELETAEVTQRSAAGMYIQHKVYSKPKWTGELTIKRVAPLDATKDNMWKWFNAIRDKGMSADNRNGERKDGSIVIYGSDMKEIARWNFYEAWPSKISQDSLTVGSNDAVSESITLQFEKLERKK
ncbi:MAG TPA: phage tail protein [Acidimicrobiales bacterium]|nr:phage tail protein [Acidimicrobiales bacterium]